jgi:hypothetical protein
MDHIQGGVTEHELQGPGIATVAEVKDSEGMAEAVDSDVRDGGTAPDTLQELAQDGTIEGLIFIGDEEGLAGVGIAAQGGEVAEEAGAGASGEGDRALFSALTEHFDTAVAQVDVVDTEIAELGSTDPGIEEEENNRPVTIGSGERIGGRALTRAGIGGGLIQGSEHRFQIGLGIRDDSALLRSGAVHAVEDMGGSVRLICCPGPERRETGVVIEEGLSGDRLRGKELADEGGGDIVEQGIIGIQESSELAESVVIIGDSPRG